MEDLSQPLNNNPSNPELPKPSCGTHLKVLLWKQYLTHKRNWKGVLCITLSPFMLCLFLLLMQFIADTQVAISIPNPPVYNLGGLPKCIPPPYNSSCVTVGYGILGEANAEWIDHTMQYVAQHAGLTFGQDIKKLWMGTNITEFNTYFINNTNMTQIAVLFCTGSLDNPAGIGIDCQNPFGFKASTYILFYNNSLVSTDWMNNPALPFPTYPLAFNTKMLVDSGIIDYFNPNADKPTTPYLQGISMQSFPEPPLRYYQGLDVVNADGPLYFFIAPIIVFMVFLSELAQEKDKKLRQGLIVVGVSHFNYFLSWIVVALVYSIIVPTVLVSSGYLFQFELFLQVPYFLLFTVFFGFTLGMCFFALFVYTLVPSAKAANTFSYALLLVGLVLQMFLSQNSLLKYIYDTTNTWLEVTIINLFNLYPAFPFAKVWGDISSKAGNRFSSGQGKWIPGPGYNWSSLNVVYNGTNSEGDVYTIPAAKWSIFWFFFEVLIYIGLIFYTDHVISSNRGSADGYFFFLSPSYWKSFGPWKNRFRKQRRTIGGLPSSFDVEGEAALQYDTVLKEKTRVINNSKGMIHAAGVRIEGVSKTYKKWPCGCKSKQDVHALKNIYLEIDEGELFGLLGHNGAGKSTLIGILTGILGGFQGRITINGLDITQDKGDVKELIGVCPQFDILWGEMTAREHLYMFAMIKGLPSSAIPAKINELLAAVNLSHVGDHQAKTFSGGMKRRLSLAISTIGNPKIIFLDEPTTGMDPKNRRHVWSLIKEMKKDRSVILTTHAMEEADALSDRIAVIVDGQFKCIGTSLFLKNNFGEGYRLTLVVDPSNIDTTKQLISKKLPSAVLLDESGGSMVFSIPTSQIQELNVFFRIIENKDDDEVSQQLRQIVSDWGLSQTTLEEVFMKVTGKKEKRARLSSVDLNKMKKK